MRLHELAKEIGAESKDLLKLAKGLGLRVRNHSSNLADGEVAILKAAYREEFGSEPVTEEEEAPATEAASPRRRRRRGSSSEASTSDSEEDASDSNGDGSASSDSDQDDGTDGADESADDYAEEFEPPTVVIEAETSDDSESVEADVAEGDPAPPTPVKTKDPTPEPPQSIGGASPPKEVPADLTTVSKRPDAPKAAPTKEPSRPAESNRPAARKEGGATGSDPATRKMGERPLKGHVTTGKPDQTPTPRKRTGARILGRIELPPEEKNRSRTRTAPSTTSDAGGPSTGPVDPTMVGPGRVRGGGGGDAAAREQERRRGGGQSRGKEDTIGWSPDDEDDPLLQGIRVRNVQAGPHTRRPPRRVGPRRSGRRPTPMSKSGPVDVTFPISVRELSQTLGEKANDILRILMGKGILVHVNAILDENSVLEVAAALNRDVNLTAAKGKEDEFLDEIKASDKKRNEGINASRKGRPPVVAFLGHVDHGKTSLLDFIRKTEVAAGEAGGITQSMRAYSVHSPGGGTITFLDTPGHKAFTEMRARGAHVTDIVVLVVAADDGVMPQTAEAIQHALAADVPIVVAINKVDRPDANIDKVLQQLASSSVMVEGWGGEVQYAAVSAITGQGIEDLLEKISLQAEIMDLQADADRPARGTVLEARKDDQLGAISTVLIQEGTLRVGDVALSGTAYGRVRKLIDDQGRNIDEATPSMPVNVVGLNAAPNASDTIFVVDDLRQAREVAEERAHSERQERVGGPAPTGQITLENLFESLEAGKAEEIKIVLRCDVKGSLEVVKRTLQDLEQKEVRVKIIREALGGVTEDDVVLAIASQAIVIGFNVIADDKARSLAESKSVDVRTYQVIYELIDDVKAAMEGLLSPLKKENVVGHVEIREVFKVSRLGNIAGCRVTDGLIRRNSIVRLTRDGRIVHTGTLDSLRRIKDDVREVKEGLECGLRLNNYDDIKVGDVIEVIEYAEERRTLDFESPAP